MDIFWQRFVCSNYVLPQTQECSKSCSICFLHEVVTPKWKKKANFGRRNLICRVFFKSGGLAWKNGLQMVHDRRDSTVSDLRRIPVCNWVPWPSQRCPNRSTVLFGCLCWVRFMVDKWYEKATSFRDNWHRKQRRLWYFVNWYVLRKCSRYG